MVAFIEEYQDVFGVEPICRQLPIAPSTFYEHQARRVNPDLVSIREKCDAEPRGRIHRVWNASFQVCGARKVWRELNREGVWNA